MQIITELMLQGQIKNCKTFSNLQKLKENEHFLKHNGDGGIYQPPEGLNKIPIENFIGFPNSNTSN